MRKVVKKKILSTHAETITEVLVALLISALSLAMLAGMVTTSTRLVSGSENTMTEYYSVNNNLAKGSEEDGVIVYKDGTVLPDTKVVRAKIVTTEITTQVKSGTGIIKLSEGTKVFQNKTFTNESVEFFLNESIDGSEVVSYKKK